MAGRTFTQSDKLPPGVRVYQDFGYDGQFYYRFALNSFTRQVTANPLKKAGWLLYAGLASILDARFWIEDWAYMRVLVEFFVLGSILLLSVRRAVRLPLTAATLVLWYFVFESVIRLDYVPGYAR